MVAWRVHFPLISAATLDTLRSLWSAGGEEQRVQEAFARHTATWADYTHLQYTSALCIMAGSLARRATDPGVYQVNSLLMAMIALFLLAALTSDWRLRRGREELVYGAHTRAA